MRIAMIGMGAVGSVFGMDLFNASSQEFLRLPPVIGRSA